MNKLLAFSVFFVAFKSFALIEVIENNKKTFTNPDCKATKSCELKEFTLWEQKKKVTGKGGEDNYPSFMSDVRVIYKTDTVKNIEKFAIVQFIKGCQFDSIYDGKTVTKDVGYYRDHFGQNVIFKHPVWMIDSDSADPIYTSYKNKGRWALLRWNKDPKSFTPDQAFYYALKRPTHPVVFATDLPGTSFATDPIDGIQKAKNSSLEFSTCIFKTVDLPKTTDTLGKNIDRSKALQCFTWSSNYIFDFQAQEHKVTQEIDPVCLNEN